MEKELWTVTGTSPVTWAIPFWVEKHGAIAHIWRAMALTPFQQAALSSRLGTLPKIANDGLKISFGQLRRIGQRVKDITAEPEDQFVWERRRRIKIGIKRKSRAERNEFLSLMYLNGVGRSEAELEYWLNQFCNAFLWHLINKETPIDLYFFKLHPSPFRRNWHEVSREMKLLHKYSAFKLLAWDGTACMRGIELEICPTWTRIARRAEADRIEMLGDHGYALRYRAWIKRVREASRRLHRDYMIYSKLRMPPEKVKGRFVRSKLVPPQPKIPQAERQKQLEKKQALGRIQIVKAYKMRAMKRRRRWPEALQKARRFILRDPVTGKFNANGTSPNGEAFIPAQT